MRTSSLALAAFAASVVASRVASAAESPAIEYVAPDGCPAVAQFVDSVASRGVSVRPRGPLDAASFLVTITASNDGFVGRLTARGSDGSISSPREVHGATCDEVAQALSVVVAIAVHPNDAPPTKTASSSEAEAPHAGAPKLHELGAFDGGKWKPLEPDEVRVFPTTTISILGGAAFGVLPKTPVPSVDVEVTNAKVVATGPEVVLIEPITRVHWSFFADSYSLGGTKASIFGATVDFGFCRAPYFDTRGLQILVCGEVGVTPMSINVTGAAAHKARNVAIPTAGLALDLHYNFGGWLNAVLSGDIDYNFGDVAAQLDDGSRLFTVSKILGHVSLGLGGSF